MIKTIILLSYFTSLYFMIFWLLVLIEKGTKEEKKSLRKYPHVTICVPAYNEETNIKATINSLLSLDYPKDKINIIVVNDGSTDRTKDVVKKIIKENKDRKIILINQKNKGKAAALNKALSLTKTEFFITLDADSIVNKKALKIILPYFKNRNIAAVLPTIKVLEKNTIIQKIQYCEYLINFFLKKLMSYLNVINVTPGPFSVYRTKIIKKLGGFDEKNLTEDMEMALKIQKAHYKIIQIIGVDVLTKAPKTFKQFYKQRNRWYKGSILNLVKYREMIFRKRYGDLGLFQLPMIFISALFSVTLFLIFIFVIFLKPLIQRVRALSLIHFDITPLIKYGLSNFSWLNLNLTPMFYGLMILIIGLIFIYISYKHHKESLKKSRLDIFLYLLIYPFVISIIWLGVIIDLLRGKIQKW